MNIFKFMVAFMLPFLFINSISAEEPEFGEVIIQTDGTYNDHEIITACEVGKIVKLDIGSYDTAYLNNNFDFNANIDGYIYFECGNINDIKLAYYGINPTIIGIDTSLLSDSQLNHLKTLNYKTDLLVYYVPADSSVTYSYDISYYNTANNTISFSNFYSIKPDGSITLSNWTINNFYLDPSTYYIGYFKYNDELIYDGLSSDITTMYYISVSAEPTEGGSVSGGGWFHPGDSVTLTATANSDYSFLQWSNGSSSNPYTFEVNTDFDLTAYFLPSDILDNQVYKITTYTDPVIIYEPYDPETTSSTATYLYYTINTTYLGNKLNIYWLTTEGYALIQSGIDSYSVSSSGSSVRTCSTLYAPCNPPDLPRTTTQIAPSFGSDNFIVTASVPEGVIEVYNPSSDSLISDGNNTSQSATDKNEQQNAELDSVINEYNEIEGQFKDNLDSSLDSIDFSFDFGNITDFSTSANFVRTQFDNLTNNPLGSLVGFSLAVGLALLIMGRRL